MIAPRVTVLGSANMDLVGTAAALFAFFHFTRGGTAIRACAVRFR